MAHLPSYGSKLANKSQDLWTQALNSLDEEERALVDFGDSNWLSILESAAALAEDKRKQCLQNRWSIKVFGKKIILRDVFAKIIRWIQKFKEIGDVAVQYDPAHTALPWAGIRLLLQVAISENQVFGAMIDGLAWVIGLLAEYAIYEAIYFKESSPAAFRLKDVIVTLYSKILVFLAKAINHFRRSTVIRIAQSVVTCTETTIQAMLTACHQLNFDATQAARLVDAERHRKVLLAVDSMVAHNLLEPMRSQPSPVSIEQGVPTLRIAASTEEEHLWQIFDNLAISISRVSEEMQMRYDTLDEDARMAVYHWLSTIPYTQHHQNARKDRLYDSGNWIFAHPQFQSWVSVSYSTILWIHGIPGSGKSKILSRIVDHVLIDNATDKGKAPMAYFYCSKDPAEPERADPERILLSIARQLSGNDVTKPLRDATLRKFSQIKKEGIQIRTLSLDETISLILELTSTSPATIILDALDECKPDRRYELFDALDRIVLESSNIVKVLVSSRDDGDIVCKLERSPNVYINPDYTSEDIRRFVVHEVSLAIERKRLLMGKVSEDTRLKIIKTLQDGAQAMFRWVSLQIQALCNPQRIKVEADLLEELGRLPQDLHDAYEAIYNQLLDSGKHSKTIGVRVLQWLRVAQRPLRVAEIRAAVLSPKDSSISELTTRDILNMTCNLVVKDTAQDCLRYAHISVLEFLDQRLDFTYKEAHRVAAERCLQVYFPAASDPNDDPMIGYANNWWPAHYTKVPWDERCAGLRDTLLDFCFIGSSVAPTFVKWRKAINDGSAEIIAATSPSKLACLYGILEILEYSTSRYVKLAGYLSSEHNDLRDNDYFGYHEMHMAVHCGHHEVVKYLLDHGASSSQCTEQGETLLHVAARCRQASLMDLLLRAGADPDALSSNAKEAYRETCVTEEDRWRPEVCRTLALAPRVTSSLGFRKDTGGVLSVLDEDSEAALHLTARTGDAECLIKLLQHNANVNLRTTLGSTALHLAVLKRQKHIVEILLKAGANANAALTYGRTPLHLAAALGQREIVPLLLQHGADPHFKDISMNTAQSIAIRYGHSSSLVQSLGLPFNPSVAEIGPSLRKSEKFKLNVTEWQEDEWEDEVDPMDKELDERLNNW